MARLFQSAPTWVLAILCFASVPVVVSLVLAYGPDPRAAEAALPLHQRDADYVGANTCRTCHPDRFTSWRRTYHSTMTQLPSRASVLGRFDGNPVTAFGATATPIERDGRFFFRLPGSATSPGREAEVALAVGSRRYQQYFERSEGESGVIYQRLPLLWHVGEARWMHLNGVFLEPDSNDWNTHRAVWNANCIFCHNTGVTPGLSAAPDFGAGRPAKRFDSHVADLGIACESCHGPGRDHARRQASLVGRYGAQMGVTQTLAPTEAPSGDVISPPALAQAESAALCGQCHSQRLPRQPEDIWKYLDSGPSFRPGDRLEDHVTPLTAETPVPDPSQPQSVFRERFWRDGVARLTAYEYLGLTQSPCFKGGDFSCSSCHKMHGGDVNGQLEPRMRGDDACTQCHGGIGQNVSAHTHHPVASSGSRCLDCHMPRVVYGVLAIHRSHRVESPDVRRDVEAGRPNACTMCHLDRDALWAADRMRDFWGARYERPRSRPDGAPMELPEALASLHAGDPVQRAVYFSAVGRMESAVPPRQRGFVLAHGLVGLGDGYGAIRTIARQSALALDHTMALGLRDGLRAFDVQGARTTRDPALAALLRDFERAATSRLGAAPGGKLLSEDYRLDLAGVRALLERQSGHAISIGE